MRHRCSSAVVLDDDAVRAQFCQQVLSNTMPFGKSVHNTCSWMPVQIAEFWLWCHHVSSHILTPCFQLLWLCICTVSSVTWFSYPTIFNIDINDTQSDCLPVVLCMHSFHTGCWPFNCWAYMHSSHSVCVHHQCCPIYYSYIDTGTKQMLQILLEVNDHEHQHQRLAHNRLAGQFNHALSTQTSWYILLAISTAACSMSLMTCLLNVWHIAATTTWLTGPRCLQSWNAFCINTLGDHC